jgi:hypothetical protein
MTVVEHKRSIHEALGSILQKKMRRGFGLGLICQLTKDITAFGFTPCPLTLWETVELG